MRRVAELDTEECEVFVAELVKRHNAKEGVKLVISDLDHLWLRKAFIALGSRLKTGVAIGGSMS